MSDVRNRRMVDRPALVHVLPIDASQDARGYTYLAQSDILPFLRIGQLVQIPFRNDMTEGIVADIVSCIDTPEGIKPIQSILCPTPVLNPAQIATILEYASRQAIHIHKVVALFLPSPVRNRVKKYWLPLLSEQSPETSNQTGGESPQIELRYCKHTQDVMTQTLRALESPRVAVIVPSERYIDMIRESVSQEFQKDIGIFRSDFTDTNRAKFWIDVCVWKFSRIIWTRRLVLYNLSEFDRIVYLEDALFKEILHSFHRYRVLDILESISLSSRQSVSIISSTPSVESMAKALAKRFVFVPVSE